jgi:hypothetical protein
MEDNTDTTNDRPFSYLGGKYFSALPVNNVFE